MILELLTSLLMLVTMLLLVRLIASSKKRQRELMNDEDVDWHDWKYGDPDDPVPDDAVKIRVDKD